MQKALIIGMGESGVGAYKWLMKLGVNTVCVDKHPEKGEELGIEVLSDQTDLSGQTFDMVVPSPGLSLDHPLVRQAVRGGAEIVGELELGLRSLKGPIIGITGTNGKTTMTLFLEHMFNAAGRKAVALGNVGKSVCSFLDRHEDETSIKLIEMSSFQLETLRIKCVDVGLITSFAKDHMDRHKSMQAYAEAKLKLCECLKEEGVLLVDESTQQALCRHTGFDKTKCAPLLEAPFIEGIPLPSSFFALSWTVASRFGLSLLQWEKAVKTFKRPAHRLEFVTTLEGVDFYDDSKATNEEALEFALSFFKRPLILILGGQDKGLDLERLTREIERANCRVIAYGQAGPKLYEALRAKVSVSLHESFEAAVEKSLALGRKGDVVLLSPACTSWDQFPNFEKRGESFKQMIYQSRRV